MWESLKEVVSYIQLYSSSQLVHHFLCVLVARFWYSLAMYIPVNSLFSSGCYKSLSSWLWTAGNQNAMVVPVPISTCASCSEVDSVASVVSMVFNRSLITMPFKMAPIDWHPSSTWNLQWVKQIHVWVYAREVVIPGEFLSEFCLRCGSHVFHLPHCLHFWVELLDLKK